MIKHSKPQNKVVYLISQNFQFSPRQHFWTFTGAFTGIGIIGLIHEFFSDFGINEKIFLIGSFGASAVLIYGAKDSPLAQSRNLIGGHLISAFIGVSSCKLLSALNMPWFNASFAVALSIVAMQCTKTLHPPGGATALIANMGTPKIIGLGYLYMIYPVLTGVLILYIIAAITGRLQKEGTISAQRILTAPIKLLAKNEILKKRNGY